MKYNIISADSHLDLAFMPRDVFVSNAPAEWRNKVPQVIEADSGVGWYANGVFLARASGRSPYSLTPENDQRIARIAATGFYDDAEKGRPHPTTLELRLADQELDGVDAEVLYGLTFIGARLLGVDKSPSLKTRVEPAPELVSLIFRIYNDWLVDFCKKRPDRLAGLACIPNHDPEEAAKEVYRVARMGIRGVEFEVQSTPTPIYYEEWDILWKAAAECNLPVSFHLLHWYPRLPLPKDADKYHTVWMNLDMVLSPMFGAEFLNTILLTGACERYPDFKFVIGEGGACWIPYLLDRMDHECKGYPGMRLKPSEYWSRQGYTTYQDEGLIGNLAQYVGEDNVMWGSDYPHPDSVWPDSREVISRNLSALKDEKIRRKLICDNAAKLYGFN